MHNGNFMFKVVIVGSPIFLLIFNELNRIKKLRENQKIQKNLFLSNFDRSEIKNENRNVDSLKRGNGLERKEGEIFKNAKRRTSSVSDEEALNYYYGKAWGYTTDYEIDLSLKTGDLIFIKHDLDNSNIFKKILLLVNRHLQNSTIYDELGIIWKKHGISYVYIQNVLKNKEKLMRYSYFLQQYQPSVVTLRRFLCEDENIRKELEKHITEHYRKNQNTQYSIFLNIICNIFRRRQKEKRKETKQKIVNQESGNAIDCQCNQLICKQLHFTIEINNLINMLLYRSFNLFFYFSKYINEQNVLNTNKENILLLNKIQSPLIHKNDDCYKIKKQKTNFESNILQTKKKENPNDSYLSMRHFLEFPLSSLTHFPFISKDCESMRKNAIFYEQPEEHVVNEIEKILNVLIDNEHSLLDTLEYINRLNGKQIKKQHDRLLVNSHQFSIFSVFNKVLSKLSDNFPFNIRNKRPLNSNHVYDIYKKTHLLPPFCYDINYKSFSFFLCLNNLYKPFNAKILSNEKFILPKLSNSFHVRQEEAEKLQKYFYQFNKIPRS